MELRDWLSIGVLVLGPVLSYFAAKSASKNIQSRVVPQNNLDESNAMLNLKKLVDNLTDEVEQRRKEYEDLSEKLKGAGVVIIRDLYYDHGELLREGKTDVKGGTVEIAKVFKPQVLER